ncbi:PREDICTED: protein WVD2-like 7 [Camelina sativa]|uniref:Protein WVD2-like 7 n=1 Tax=Camelina sativa TaxID=90675 RepID=A0ABM0WXJ5_CAMSA|nr:PREDICTED: protein WVD2-like 7 [Camelina sativa]
MMSGEVQEQFNLSRLENSIHSGSVSFGRFEKSLSWERRSSFSHNRYLEEAERFSKPGSVTQMRAHFEAHFKKKGIRFPNPVEAQTWVDEVVHHQTCAEKDDNLWENTSQFGDSCVSYDEVLVNSDGDDHHTSLSVALEKTNIGHNEDEKETTSSSSATRLKPLRNVHKTNPCATTKASTKKHDVVLTKGSSPSCNTKTSTDTKRQKELKTKRIVKTIASQAPTTSKKTESLTPLVATREKRTTTHGFSFRSNERAEKTKEEKVKAVVVPKDLNNKARPLPKSTQARPQHTSTGQAKAKARDDHSSTASCDQSVVNGIAKSKHIKKHKADIHMIQRPKTSSDLSSRSNSIRRSLVVRRSPVEVAL